MTVFYRRAKLDEWLDTGGRWKTVRDRPDALLPVPLPDLS
jgi:hypothetical protein